MWISGEQAGHHTELPYEPDGSNQLIRELLKDFVKAPAADAFHANGPIRTIRDLDAAMANARQTPVPSPSALLAALLPRDELVMLTLTQARSATLDRSRQKRAARARRSTGARAARGRR
jgi:hypothetical protein